jgi:hypothetical protein
MGFLKLRAALVCASGLLAALLLIGTPAAGYARARHGRSPSTRTALTASGTGALIGGDSKTDCVYAAESISILQGFEQMVNHHFDCVLVYNNASPDWAGWDDPWFLTRHAPPGHDWQQWATAAGTHRELIITQGLFPSDLDGTNWLQAGASGAYDTYARTLARNLVAAGLGSSVIRLGHEANYTGSPWFIGTTRQSFQLWDEFWRQTVLAMRSVPGAHFLFDWCINAYWKPVPLAEWYPGNDVVNIIGIDTYDAGVPAGDARWSRLYNQPDGIKAVLQFAAAHGKPVSIPEWGLWTPGPTTLGGGNDPAYVNGIASVVRHNPVAYQSYFYNHAAAALLSSDPLSLSAYRQSFGGVGG